MRIVAADPGLAGGLAILDKKIVTIPMPIYKVGRKRVYHLDEIRHFFEECDADLFCVEAVTRPGVLVGNRWFMAGLAMAYGMHVVHVPAPKWKAHFDLHRGRSEKHSTFKRRSIQLATNLFGVQFKTDGEAEAALLALFAQQAHA